ncbi:hypothetical protein AB1Y20_005516 [Prymnesium parvum]|uniref:Major facilitator superfamily (MFS) profile domain-containing protein n=1 Tax=Prymnesium parvum TaxID=97485 RepID=A0AB34J4H7_PRYPA
MENSHSEPLLELDVNEFLMVRKYAWLPERATLAPFLGAMTPLYSGAAFQILSPIFFNPLMEREWMPETPSDEASKLMSYPTMAMFGCWIFGALAWTFAADRFGRRPATLLCGWASIGISTLSIVAWDYKSFFVLRALLGFAVGGQGATAYVWTIEWAARQDPSLLTFVGNVLFSLANALVVGVAFLGNQLDIGWRAQQLILSAVQALPFCCAFFVKETPSFLQQAGRHSEAEATLRGELSPHAAKELADCTLRAPPVERDLGSGDSDDAVPLRLLTQPTTLFRMLIVAISWFTVNLTFYGLDFSVGGCKAEDGCDAYLNGLLTAVADLPGYAISFVAADIPCIGRRFTLVFSFALCGVCLLLMVVVRATADVQDDASVLSALSFVGKCGAASAFSIVYIYPTELFPTRIRSSALGVANIGGRIAAVLSPLAANVAPFTLELALGSLAMVSAVLTLALPETLVPRGNPLTMQEGTFRARSADVMPSE